RRRSRTDRRRRGPGDRFRGPRGRRHGAEPAPGGAGRGGRQAHPHRSARARRPRSAAPRRYRRRRGRFPLTTGGFLLPERPVDSLDDWLALGGGDGLRAARRLGTEGTIDELRASGLRGRGGGGFPTGAKWAGVAAGRGTHRYVVANAAEGEPGTFKDRRLIRQNPYQLIERVAVAAFAIGAREAFIGLKTSFAAENDRL